MMPGVTFEEITSQITDAYLQSELERILRNRMDVRLDRVVASGTFDYIVFQLVGWAERTGRETELIRVTARARPTHTGMQAIYQKYGMAVPVALQQRGTPIATEAATSSGFEAKVRHYLPFLEPNVWRTQLASLESQVCRVEVGNGKMGSGFLVAPDALLTNYHVLSDVVAGTSHASAVRFRFDYKKLANGQNSDGVLVKLHPTDWRIDDCPYSQAERKNTPDAQLPTIDELDFALVRLERPLGAEPVDANPRPGEVVPARGWLTIPTAPLPITSQMPLLILQHPQAEPLKLAFDTEGVISVNGNGTRVRYATNTEGGSSGGPCLDLNWNLIALHHYGDPHYGHPKYNQGIPIGMIRERPTRMGRANVIDS